MYSSELHSQFAMWSLIRPLVLRVTVLMSSGWLAGMVSVAQAQSTSRSGQQAWQAVALGIRTALQANRPILEIGVLDGDSPEVFGHITKVIVDPIKGLFVLDRQIMAVKWFDFSGKFVGSAGRAGRGPGEFRAPYDLVLDSDKQVHVLDVSLGRVSVFSPGAEGLGLIGDVRLERSGDRFCMLANHYYLLTPGESLIVQRVEPGGQITHAFAEQVATIHYTDVPAARAVSFRVGQNRGHLFCDAKRKQVIIVHRETGIIRAYRSTGEPVWTARLADFNEGRWERYRDDIYMRASNVKSGRVSFAGEVVGLTEDILGVMVADGGLTTGSPHTRMLRLLSMDTGRELTRIPAQDLVVAGLHDGRLYTYSQQPYPRVLVFNVLAQNGVD